VGAQKLIGIWSITFIKQRYFYSADPFEEFWSFRFSKARIERFDHEEERVIGNSLKRLVIKEGMMKPGKPVHDENAKKSGEGRE
jgi:hypothetical protein